MLYTIDCNNNTLWLYTCISMYLVVGIPELCITTKAEISLHIYAVRSLPFVYTAYIVSKPNIAANYAC